MLSVVPGCALTARTRWCFCFVLAAFVWATASNGVGALAQNLPQQMGAINDYAAALGGKPQRAPLKDQIETLLKRHGVQLVLLLSERNPFDDVERYGVALQQAWRIPQSQSVFSLFLKRKGRWYVRLWPSSDVLSVLGGNTLETLRKQVEQQARKGRVRQAAQQLVTEIINAFEAPSEPTSGSARPRGAGLGWLGLLFALLALWGVWRWLRSFCPRCTRRLNVTTRGKRRLRSCPRCGYNR